MDVQWGMGVAPCFVVVSDPNWHAPWGLVTYGRTYMYEQSPVIQPIYLLLPWPPAPTGGRPEVQLSAQGLDHRLARCIGCHIVVLLHVSLVIV